MPSSPMSFKSEKFGSSLFDNNPKQKYYLNSNKLFMFYIDFIMSVSLNEIQYRKTIGYSLYSYQVYILVQSIF